MFLACPMFGAAALICFLWSPCCGGGGLWISFLLIVIQSDCLFWSSFLAAVSCSEIAFGVSGLIGGTVIWSKRAERFLIK